MKKIFLTLILVIFSSTVIFGSSINVTNPNSSTVLLKGQVLKISWVKTGVQNNYVKIRLFSSNGSSKILGIAERAKNSGLFKWSFNGNVPDGQYFIRVKTKDDKVTGNSKVFRIGKNSSPPPPPPPGKKSLDVTCPNGGENLSKNYPVKITWDASGVPGNLNVELWKGNRKYGTIASNVPVSQKFLSWTVGNTFGNAQAGEGEDYRIRIAGTDINDMSDRYFSITSTPGIIDNQINNMKNNTHTFKNPPQQMMELATPPVIEEIKVWSKDPKFRGQVKHGESFDIRVRLKNTSKTTDKNDWTIETYLDNKIFLKKTVKNSTSPKKPGTSWWYTMANAGTDRLPNKSGLHILKIKLNNSSKSTMLGILFTDNTIYPDIRNFKIWNKDCQCWSNRAKHKKGHLVELQYEVVNAVRITFTNMSSNKILRIIELPNRYGKGKIDFISNISGYIKMNAVSFSNNIKDAKVYIDTTKPLQVGDKFLDFEMWRVKRNIKTRGMVQGYRSVMFYEVLDNGKERLLKVLKADTFQSSRLDWEFHNMVFPINFKLVVTYLDYSKEIKTRTFN